MKTKDIKSKAKNLAQKLTYDLGVGAFLLGTGALFFGQVGSFGIGFAFIAGGVVMVFAAHLFFDENLPP